MPRSNQAAAKPSRVLFVDEAYRTIKAKILDNEMHPGYRALESELALQLGMSRTPLREALMRLQSEGFVRLTPRRGMMVLPISPEDMNDIYQIITALESAAAENLAARGLSAAELKRLDKLVDTMARAVAKDDLDTWSEADEQFHRTLLELCGNARLAHTALLYRDQLRRTRKLTMRLRPKPTKSVEAHRKLVDAIRKRNADAAREIHHGQRARASQELTEILRQYRLSSL